MPDQDGYPTDEEIQKIKEWPLDISYIEYFDFIRSCWWSADWGWHEEDTVDELFNKPVHRYSISTGGWSGNEDIIGAMKENAILWVMTWVQSRRGGHFIFQVQIAPPSPRGRAKEEG
jgi:hypothetical protein